MVAPVSLRPGLYSQLCCYKTELSSTVRWLEWELPALTTSENQAERESQTYVWFLPDSCLRDSTDCCKLLSTAAVRNERGINQTSCLLLEATVLSVPLADYLLLRTDRQAIFKTRIPAICTIKFQFLRLRDMAQRITSRIDGALARPSYECKEPLFPFATMYYPWGSCSNCLHGKMICVVSCL